MFTNNFSTQFAGDLHFWHGIHRAVLSRAYSNGRGKTFYYQFDLRPEFSFGKMFFNVEYDGASHGEDMMFIFRYLLPGMKAPAIDSKEFDDIKKVIGYIGSFIIDGNPASFDNKLEWPAVTPSTTSQCLDIKRDSMEIIRLPQADALRVWDEILEEAKVPVY